MLDTVHQIQPRPTHTKAGVLVIQWTLLNKSNLYLKPPRSTSWNWLLHIWEFYIVINFRKKIRTITGGPWWTQIKVALIQKGLLNNQNPSFCVGWPGLYLMDSIEHSRSVWATIILTWLMPIISNSDQQNTIIYTSYLSNPNNSRQIKSCYTYRISSYSFRPWIVSSLE